LPKIKKLMLNRSRIRQMITLVLLMGAMLCIFPPQHAWFQWWAAQALYVALGYLALAMLLLILDRQRLMFVCLGCTAAISFFHHETNVKSVRIEPVHSGIFPREASATEDIFALTYGFKTKD
jgi:hypothetical protein